MSRLLFPQSTFAPIVGLELPPIPNLVFATFLGSGVINAKDGTNIVPGGGAFTTFGNPVKSLNFVTTDAPNDAIQTPMVDTGDAHTIVWVTLPIVSGFASSMSFVGASTTTCNQLYISSVPTMRCGGGPLTTSAGNADIALTVDTTKWNLLAFVIKGGKPTVGYNLTTGLTYNSPTNMILAGRPATGNWFIGNTGGSYSDPSKVAFALGANTEMSASALNTLASALRYPLRDREIYV